MTTPRLIRYLLLIIFTAGVTYVLVNLSYPNSQTSDTVYSLTGKETYPNEQVTKKRNSLTIDETIRQDDETKEGSVNHDDPTVGEDSIEAIVTESQPYYTFIIFIISAPDHTDHRNVLREKSWPNYAWRDKDGNLVEKWKYMFVVGKTESEKLTSRMEKEVEIYKDMIIADELDSYHNLVLKVLWILEYSVQNYNFGFLIKTDDDTFINIKLLNEFISSLPKQNSELFYGGVRIARQPVLRKGRYGVPKELWKPDIYAPYCSGSGYMLSNGSVSELLRVHQTGVQPLFYVEDAFMGALAHHSGKLDPVNVKGFYWHQKYGCVNKNAILMHYVKLEMLEDYMKKNILGVAYC